MLLISILRRKLAGTFGCYAVLSLCLALIASWWEPSASDVRFSMLDVGQGQCLLLQSKGRIYMVDCGGDSDARSADAAAETLLSQGFSQIDGCLLTPPDRDHAGGAENFLSRIRTEKSDILITLDRNAFGARALMRHADIPDVDILVAGHHGSRYSTCEELLSVARPEIVCVSAGADNPYGHPAPEVLERLSDFGCTVYRTDRQGTITIRR